MSKCGHRAASSRVPADPDIREKEGGGLTDTISARKADRNEVSMFRIVSSYQQSTKDIGKFTREQCHGDNYFTEGPRLKTEC